MSIKPRRGLPDDDAADPNTQTDLPTRAADSGTRLSGLLNKLPRIDTQAGNRAVRIAVPIVAALSLTGTVAGATALRNGAAAAPVATQDRQPAGFDPTNRNLVEPKVGPAAPPSTNSGTPSKPGTPSGKAPAPSQLRDGTKSPDKTPSKSAQPKKRATPEPGNRASTKVVGTRYATESVNVRSAASAKSNNVGSLDVGDRVQITANTIGGWQQIEFKGTPRWVKSEFLSKQRPKSEPSSSPDARSGSGNRDSGSSKGTGGSCNRDLGSKAGLSASASRTWDAVCANFPDVETIGGTRGGDGGSYHSQGRAIDVMISGDRGQEIARWARANAAELGVIEVIYQQKIWTTQRNSEGWRSQGDRGSATQNHLNNLHISTK